MKNIIIGIFIATRILAQLEIKPDPEMSTLEIVDNIYKSNNIESIKELCLDWHLRGTLLAYLSDVPYSPWKEDVSLAFIESPWPADRTPGKPAPPGINPPLASYYLAVELLSPLLPEEQMQLNDEATYRKLSSFDDRKLLVAKYREARAKQIINDPEGKDELQSEKDHESAKVDTGADFTYFPEPEGQPGLGKRDNKNSIQTKSQHDLSKVISKSLPEEDRSPWIVVGVLIIGVLALFFKVWKGKAGQ